MSCYDREAELARCEEEIAAMLAQSEDGAPAWLTVLGVEDWEAEQRLILKELGRATGMRPRRE